jgi:hypothetical protein
MRFPLPGTSKCSTRAKSFGRFNLKLKQAFWNVLGVETFLAYPSAVMNGQFKANSTGIAYGVCAKIPVAGRQAAAGQPCTEPHPVLQLY